MADIPFTAAREACCGRSHHTLGRYACRLYTNLLRALDHFPILNSFNRPPKPKDISEHRDSYSSSHPRRLSKHGRTPLRSLFRMYEFLLLDDMEAFDKEAIWFSDHHKDENYRDIWAFGSIPNPIDWNSARLAIIAFLAHYMVGEVINNVPRPKNVYPDFKHTLPSWYFQASGPKDKVEIKNRKGDDATKENWEAILAERNIIIHKLKYTRDRSGTMSV